MESHECAKCGKLEYPPCLSADGKTWLCMEHRREEIHKSDMEEIWALMQLDTLDKSQEYRLDELTVRAFCYEDARYPMENPSPEALIEFWKDQGIL